VAVARSKLSFPWDDILLLHVGIVQDRDQGNLQQAYEDQKELVQYVYHSFWYVWKALSNLNNSSLQVISEDNQQL
jgi:hypothetical protein